MLSRPVQEFTHPVTQLEKIYTKDYQTKDAFKAGLIAGGASIAGAHWLDVWKVQRQTKGANFSLIKGISPAIVSQSLRTGVTYCGFDSLKGWFKSHGLTGFGWEFIAASLGAAIGETITNPMTVIKNASIKHQAIPTKEIPGYLYQRNGMGAFTKGIMPAMLRKSLSNGGLLSASPYCVGWVMSAFTFCNEDAGKSSTYKTASKLLGGGFAGAVMEVLTLPLDKWKVYNQAVINPVTGRTYSSLEAAKLVYQEGYTAMFAGGFSAFSRKFGIKAIQYYVLLEAVDLLRNRSLAKIDLKLSAEEAEYEAAADAVSKPMAAVAAAVAVKV